jgi:type IV pilus assembly protein PilB
VAVKKTEQAFGNILVEEGFIDEGVLAGTLEEHEHTGKKVSDILLQKGLLSPEQVAISLSRQHGIPYLPLSEYELDPEIAHTITEDMARKYRMVPVDETGNVLTVALADPANVFLLDNIRRSTGMEIVPLLSLDSDIEEAINKYYGDKEALQKVISEIHDNEEVQTELLEDRNDEDLEDAEVGAPVIRLVNLIITEAIKSGTSDIHFDPGEKDYRLRYRIDGVLKDMPPPPKRLQNAITSRVKIMADLDISEKRHPQDGRFRIRSGGKVVDFRVSVLPTVHGEKVVLRLLDKSNLNLDLKVLGFEAEQLKQFEEVIKLPYGQILVTGPTGSGKSTTLYSALSTINQPDVNIITVEDPVEYQIKGINQVHARADIGFSFADALRSILRQDPDVIMIGEIRDFETAEIAIKAALTCHLVLSTLHTNDAPSTITRLVDMGVEKFLVTSSVVLIVAQRLVRRICPKCKEDYQPSEVELLALGVNPDEHPGAVFAKGTGCSHCADTGYKGRLAIHEVLRMTENLAECIMSGMHTNELRREARRQGMLTLRDSGIRKVLNRITTPEEILRVSIADVMLDGE